jgi:hypothetical protein
MSERPKQEDGDIVPVEALYAPRMSAELVGPFEPDGLSLPGEMRWELTIWLHRSLLEHNPQMRLVCEDRVFRVIEETLTGELDDRLFREQRTTTEGL